MNSFKVGSESYWPGKNKITTIDLLKRAAKANLTAMDLNYPDHFIDCPLRELTQIFEETGISLNGLAMRYYSEASFKLGAFTNPSSEIRRLAIDQTKKGIDTVSSLNGNLMTLWMGQDGVDYSFQGNYSSMWDWTIEAIAEIADYNPDVNIAIEYKPNEPRAFSLLPDAATTLLAIKDIGRKNTGVVIDFAHVLYADEMPAFSANLISRYSQILGVHLNDGYGKWDNGLMVATVHPIQTIELLVELKRIGYDGAIYFDTFPDHSGLDPVAEANTNISTVEKLLAISDRLVKNLALQKAIAEQDATISMQIIQTELLR